MSPDHDQSALFLSATLNLVLFLIISALLIFVFKRSLRQRWRRRAQRNSESLPLLNIAANESDLNQQPSPYGGQQQPPQQQPPQQQPPQQQEQQPNDDLVSVDLESQTSDHDVTDVQKTKWFQRMFKKR